MKTKYYTFILVSFISIFYASCSLFPEKEKKSDSDKIIDIDSDSKVKEDHCEEEYVIITPNQKKAIDLKIGLIQERSMSHTVESKGIIEVPPSERHVITSLIGANVSDIKVIKGDHVKKGEVLFYLEHPNFTNLQVNYQRSIADLEYLEQEYKRLKVLSENAVASGREFQKIKADYFRAQADVKGYESQLKMMKLNVQKIKEGYIYNRLPIIANQSGDVVALNITKGMYIAPQTNLMEIVNRNHMHLELSVYESDYPSIKQGQKVSFQLNGDTKEEYKAEILSMNKSFNTTSRSILVNAEIHNPSDKLIPGLYVRATIFTQNEKVRAVKEAAIVSEADKSFVFVLDKIHEEDGDFQFRPVEVIKGTRSGGYVEVTFIEDLSPKAQIALNGAYYLLAEMQKGEHEDTCGG